MATVGPPSDPMNVRMTIIRSGPKAPKRNLKGGNTWAPRESLPAFRRLENPRQTIGAPRT